MHIYHSCLPIAESLLQISEPRRKCIQTQCQQLRFRRCCIAEKFFKQLQLADQFALLHTHTLAFLAPFVTGAGNGPFVVPLGFLALVVWLRVSLRCYQARRTGFSQGVINDILTDADRQDSAQYFRLADLGIVSMRNFTLVGSATG